MTYANEKGPEQSGPRAEGVSEDSPRSSLDWARQAGVARNVIQELELRMQGKRRGRRRRRMATVAGAALLIMVMVALRQNRARSDDSPVAATNATVSVPERELLADGSIVELNAGARISVDYRDTVRRIVLEKGEAHFQVARNPSQPFIVVAGSIEVRAVGTSFSVYLAGRAVEVFVTEGRVAVEKTAEGRHLVAGVAVVDLRPRLADLDAGKRVVIETDLLSAATPPPIMTMPDEELKNRLAWRVPRLEFSGTPLSEALDIFNRHSQVRLVLGDAQLGSLKLSGIVRADNTETLLQLLALEFGLIGERQTEQEILLNRPDASQGR